MGGGAGGGGGGGSGGGGGGGAGGGAGGGVGGPNERLVEDVVRFSQSTLAGESAHENDARFSVISSRTSWKATTLDPYATALVISIGKALSPSVLTASLPASCRRRPVAPVSWNTGSTSDGGESALK